MRQLTHAAGWRRVVGTGVLASVAACGAGLPPRPREPLVDDVVSSDVAARWVYRPTRLGALGARHELGPSRWLLAGERGERWVLDDARRTLEGAAPFTQEEIVAIVPLDVGGYAFIGASGTAYRAGDPLGPITRADTPSETLAALSVSGSALAATTLTGHLVSSADAGATWHEQTNLTTSPFVDVELAPAGRGLALALPEELFETRDGGRTWAPSALATRGTLELRRSQKGEVYLRTLLGGARWDPAAGKLEPAGKIPAGAEIKVERQPPRGPNAGAIAEGRATLEADGAYLEVQFGRDTGRSRWQLWSGRFDRPLEVRPLDELSGCVVVRLATRGEELAIACWREGAQSGGAPFELWRSHDRGKKLVRDDTRFHGHVASFSFALGRGGALVASGVCPAKDATRGCAPSGLYFLRRAEPKTDKDAPAARPARSAPSAKPASPPKGKPADSAPALELAPASAISLTGAARVAFAPDGHSVWAIARRAKSSQMAAWVSRDFGRSYTGHDLGASTVATPRETLGYGDDDAGWPASGGGSPAIAPLQEGGALVVLGDGTVSRVDDHGELVTSSRPPAYPVVFGLGGGRVLAVAAGEQRVFESNDGGASWTESGQTPVSVCGAGTCSVPVACADAGCIVGHELVRVGWSAQPGRATPWLLPQAADGRVLANEFPPGLSCAPDPGPWRALPGVGVLPTARQAAVGDVVWFTLLQDLASGRIVVQRGGKRWTETEAELLPGSSRPELSAVSTRVATGLVLALRYDVGARMTNADVVWHDVALGKTSRRRVASLGPARPLDHQTHPVVRTRLAQAKLDWTGASVAIRPHAEDPQATWIVDAQGASEVVAPIWPRVWASGRDLLYVATDTALAPFLVLDQGAGVVRADGDAFAARSLTAGASSWTRLWQGSESWLQVVVNGAGRPNQQFLVPLRGAGAVAAPVTAPIGLRELGPTPRACTAEARAAGMRVVYEDDAGTRRPVVISEAGQPERIFLTSGAVVYGTTRDACVAAFDAVPVDSERTVASDERLILPFDDLEHAVWLRHLPPDGRRSTVPEMQVRHLNCRVDPALAPPVEVVGQSGTVILR